MRALLVDRIRYQHWTPLAAASAAGISVRSAYKWLARHRTGGAGALEDRASTPHHQPRRTPPAVTARIIAARYERRTAWAIAVQLQVPRSTVAAILARAGLNRLARLAPPAPITRYEWAQPGDLVHLDVKPLARIAGVGHRIHGDQRARVRGIGWEYAHVAIDDHSRAAYVEVLPDQTGATTAAFLQRTVAWFARRGVRIARVLTDNGGNYRSRRFQAIADRQALRLKRARPYRPQTNGKAERFIQTLLREWAYARPYASSARRTQALPPWLRAYNSMRPHAALGYPHGVDRARFTLIAAFTKDRDAWLTLPCIDVTDGTEYELSFSHDTRRSKVIPQTYGYVLHLYPYREESKSLAPDGSPCTRGVLQRASVIAGQQHFVGKETDRRWEFGDDLSVLRSKWMEYRPRTTVADTKLREQVAAVGMRVCAR